jgi:mycobactin peptide synthetase MbtE
MAFQNTLIASLIKNYERIAVDNRVNLLTYGDLLARANAVTRFLLARPVPAGAKIGVLSSDRETIIISMIGIMNAACIFVPLDPAMPAKRKEAVLAELAPDCLITDLPGSGIGHDFKTILENSVLNKTGIEYPEFGGEDSIYIYFTSGSTGKPKGIVGRNKSLLQYLEWQIREFSFDEYCRVSQLISPYFDAFLRDVFVPLLSGGTICLPDAEEDFFTPAKITAWIDAMLRS